MYDVQTILSAYDKQGTLVQWLKNLDETLKSSGLESVNTIPVEGGYKLQFKFANGVVLESDLIQKINTLSIEADSVKLALADTNGVVVEYYSTLTVNGENVQSNIKILFPIKGSESVIVDVGEDGRTIEIHLDADILNDINRALKTPLANPSATEIVAVDTNGAQTMLEIGQGLKVEAGILEAEATGGGGNYVLELTGESGTLTDEQYQAVVDNFPNVSILYQGSVIDIIKTSVTASGTFLFALTILSGNIISTTSWSIASDKSWTATLDQVTIPTSSGLQIKQITFTDRPSLYSWLQSNWEKVLNTKLTSQGHTVLFNEVTLYTPTSYMFTKITSFYTETTTDLVSYNILVDGSIVKTKLGNSIRYNAEGVVSTSIVPIEQLTDEYWTATSTSVTITYIE